MDEFDRTFDRKLWTIWWWGKTRRRIVRFAMGYAYWCGAPYLEEGIEMHEFRCDL